MALSCPSFLTVFTTFQLVPRWSPPGLTFCFRNTLKLRVPTRFGIFAVFQSAHSFPLSSLVAWAVALLLVFWFCNICICLFSRQRGGERLHATSRTRETTPFASYSTRPLATSVDARGRGWCGGPPYTFTSSTLAFSRSDYSINPELNDLSFSISPLFGQIYQEM